MKQSALLFRFFLFALCGLCLTSISNAQIGYWTQLTHPPRMEAIYDMDMYDANFGVCVGPTDAMNFATGIWVTTDGGNLWIPVVNDSLFIIPLVPKYGNFRSVHIQSPNNIWVCGDSGLVYVSHDGGNFWQGLDSLYIGPRCTYRDIYFADGQNGVIVGGDSFASSPVRPPTFFHPPVILHTYDGGNKWVDESPSGPPTPDEPALYKVKEKLGHWFIVGDFGTLLEFSGSGSQWNWLMPPLNTNDQMLSNVEIIDYPAIAVSGSTNAVGSGQGMVLRTQTWAANRFSDVSPPNMKSTTQNAYALQFITSQLVWTGSNQMEIYVSTDGGGRWKTLGMSMIMNSGPLRVIDFVDSLNGWAMGFDPGTKTPWMLRYYGKPPVSDISATKTDAAFPDVRCEKYVETEVIIKNIGNGELIINSGEISLSSNEYSLVGVSYPIRIPSKKSQKVTVRWTPSLTAVGQVSGSMTIYSNDKDHSPWTITLTGTRYHGYLDVNPLVEVFNGKCLGDAEEFSTFVEPRGNETPTFISISFVSGKTDFTPLSPAPMTVIDKTTEFKFRFAPKDTGIRQAVYRIIGGNPSCPDTSYVTLRGMGLITRVQASQTVLDFGNVCIGQTKNMTITLKNIGNTYAFVDVQQFVGGTAVFPPLYSNSLVILQDSSKPYEFQFAPQVTGFAQATIRLVSVPCGDTILFTLRGTGISTEVKYSPAGAVTVGPTIVDKQVSKFVRIKNTGQTDAYLTSVKLDRVIPGLQLKNPNTIPRLLSPTQEIEVELDYKPLVVGSWSANLVTKWSSVCTDSAVLEVSAECVPNPYIEYPLSMDLGTQACPAPVLDTLYIHNRGNGPLVFVAQDIIGVNPTHFSLVKPLPGDTAFAKDSIPLIVKYQSTVEGPSRAILVLGHNDAERMPTLINLFGNRTITEYHVVGDSATEFFTRLFVAESRQFTIVNTSGSPVHITSVDVVKGASVFAVTPSGTLPITLQQGGQTTFTVVFTPNARGPFTGIIRVSGEPCSQTYLITLTGKGDTDGLSVDKGEMEILSSPCSFTSACDTIRLANQGREAIKVTSIDLQQSSPAMHFTSPGVPFFVQPGGEVPVIVCADPSYQGMHTAMLVIKNDDPAYPEFQIPVSSRRDSVNLQLSTTDIDFGMLAGCAASPRSTFSITNTGDAMETIEISRANNSPAFTMNLQSGFGLQPGKVAPFNVQFNKTGFGEFRDTVYIKGSSCPLVYTVIVHGSWEDQTYTVTPGSIIFPSVNVGSKTQRSFTVVNGGAFPGTVSSVTVTPPSGFTVMSGYPASIAAASNGVFQIEFEPTAELRYQATVCVVFNSPCADTVCVTLDGSGVQGDLALYPPTLNFGSLAQCEELTLNDTLRNEGSGEVSILSSIVNGSNAAAFTVLNPVTSTEVLGPGSERVFTIRYQPALVSTDGAVSAVLSIQTNDTRQPVVDLPLEAVKQTFAAAADITVNYGAIEPNKPSMQTVTITNTGTAPYCYLQPALPAGVTLSVAFPFCLNPGESKTVDITLTPAIEGTYQSRFGMQISAPCTDSTVVTLNANVIEGSLVQTDRIEPVAMAFCLQQTFTIDLKNGHIYQATVDSIRLTGADASMFTIINPPATPFPVASGATQVFSFEFTGVNQSRIYTARFTTYATVNGQQFTRVTDITMETVAITIGVTAAVFPPTVVTMTSAPALVTVSNNTTIPVDIASIVSNNPEFVITQMNPAPPTTLQPGQSITVTVEFRPSSVGIKSAEILVQSNSPCVVGASGNASGEGVGRTIVSAVLSIGQLSGKVDETVRIPLLLDQDLAGTDVTSWSGSLTFNKSMLYPARVVTTNTRSQDMTVDMSYDYAAGRVTLSASGGTVRGGLVPLAYVECLVLIGDSESTPIDLSDDFNLTSGYGRLTGRVPGTFTLDAFCNPKDRLISGGTTFALHQSNPNPASISGDGSTAITYHLPVETPVRIALHDAMGRETAVLVDKRETAGDHSASVDVSGLLPGVYYYTLTADGYTATRKLVIVK